MFSWLRGLVCSGTQLVQLVRRSLDTARKLVVLLSRLSSLSFPHPSRWNTQERCYPEEPSKATVFSSDGREASCWQLVLSFPSSRLPCPRLLRSPSASSVFRTCHRIRVILILCLSMFLKSFLWILPFPEIGWFSGVPKLLVNWISRQIRPRHFDELVKTSSAV